MKCDKLVVFSDVHASLGAINKINQFMKNNNIDMALNLGDFISGGQYPCEVFDQLLENKRFLNIRGYDEDCLFNELKASEAIGQGEWLRQKLGKERLKKLEAIPATKVLTINNIKILMCHNNGWSDLSQLEAHTKKLECKKYEVIVYGGSHMQELTHCKQLFYGSTLIDPGALKPNDEHQGQFAVINFIGKEVEITFHTIYITEEDIKNEYNAAHDNIVVEKQDDILKDTFLYINSKRGDEKNIIGIADEVIDRIIDIGIRQCKYVCIGCWKQEKTIIKELLYHLKCRVIKQSEQDEQEWYIGEIDDQVKDLIRNKRKNSDGSLKWFEISFQNDLSNKSMIYSLFHYGREGFLRKLTAKDLYNMEKLLERYNILYYLPEETAKNTEK